MADISPFMSDPRKWIEELAQLRAERSKLEDREDKIKTKLREYLSKEKLTELAGETHYARIESRESTDFSQKALTDYLGPKKFSTLKMALPIKTTEALTIREIKKEETPPPPVSTEKTDQITEFFGGEPEPKKKGALPWQK